MLVVGSSSLFEDFTALPIQRINVEVLLPQGVQQASLLGLFRPPTMTALCFGRLALVRARTSGKFEIRNLLLQRLHLELQILDLLLPVHCSESAFWSEVGLNLSSLPQAASSQYTSWMRYRPNLSGR